MFCTWFVGHVWNHLTSWFWCLVGTCVEDPRIGPTPGHSASQHTGHPRLLRTSACHLGVQIGHRQLEIREGNWKFPEKFPKLRCHSHLTLRWKKTCIFTEEMAVNISSIESLKPLRSASKVPWKSTQIFLPPKVWQFAVENLRRSHLFLRMFECLLFYFRPAVPYNTQIAVWLGHLLITKIVMMTVGLWKGNSWAQLILPNSCTFKIIFWMVLMWDFTVQGEAG